MVSSARTSGSSVSTAGVTPASGGERDNVLGVPTSMVIRCLILFNLVFIVQNVLDTRYLFSEDLPAGLTLTGISVVTALLLVAFAVFASYFRLWIQSFLTGAGITIWDLIGMTFRKVNPTVIVRSKIMAVQAGMNDEPPGCPTGGLDNWF